MKYAIGAWLFVSLTGCASSHVQNGALYGALTGVALGAGTGLITTDPALLGSRASEDRGHTQIETGTGVLVGASIGLVVGSVVGAMAGHQRDDGYELKPKPVAPPPPEQSEAALRPIPQL